MQQHAANADPLYGDPGIGQSPGQAADGIRELGIGQRLVEQPVADARTTEVLSDGSLSIQFAVALYSAITIDLQPVTELEIRHC